ncbi:MAG: hypothetical protein ACI4S9_01720 [Christensenellales bacterium]
MRILAVSNDLSVLSELKGLLTRILPNADIITETDPLMACKYSFKNEVNLVFTARELKRMSFSELSQFIKKEHPTVKTYLIYDKSTALDERISNEFDGIIGYPFSIEELTNTLKINAVVD